MTLPSLLNMLTSSMAWMGWTFSFFSVCWSFLSSPAERAGVRLTFLRGVPLPLNTPLLETLYYDRDFTRSGLCSRRSTEEQRNGAMDGWRWFRVHTLRIFRLDDEKDISRIKWAAPLRQLTDTRLSAQLLQPLLDVRHDCEWGLRGWLSEVGVRGSWVDVASFCGERFDEE